MFYGKNQTGYMQQPPAVNMVNQPGVMHGFPTPEMQRHMQPDLHGVMQPCMMPGMPTPGMPMEGFVPDQATPEGMFYPSHMGYVCEPCQVIPPQPQICVVQKGDTVYKIAKKYNLDWRELAGYNRLGNPDLIYPGERLFIPPR